jgi:uracil-DNA glycosylase
LKKGARNLVFADGNPAARVMIVGEAPGRDEDLQGLPFVGKAGQLLDRMFEAIGMGRASPDAERALYITNVLPWRPPENRDPSPEEIAMMLPFLRRHVELAGPEVLVLMGNHSCQALLGRRGSRGSGASGPRRWGGRRCRCSTRRISCGTRPPSARRGTTS